MNAWFPAVALPSLVTLFGLSLGVYGIALWPGHPAAVALCLSLVCDVCDGALARQLGACTPFGEWLDWTVDVVLANAIAWRCLPLRIEFQLGIVCIVGAMQWRTLCVHSASSRIQRVSGRAFVTVAAFAFWWLS